ncbi:hypothetical protein NPIL_267771 [Nephila pilipes]|uniref:Uncharacterized protein n=1 Tax=Nephila pilipes TaxID=299642 RepID=A0A8X6T011_NEPPI|nr:hypothetical protein NPIL_267771 [Nephila pilipes]
MREWSIIFYFSAALCIVAAIIFIFLGSSEKQIWNDPLSLPDESAQKGKQSDDLLIPESSENMELSSFFENRPWRTNSFPTLPDDDEPAVILKK